MGTSLLALNMHTLSDIHEIQIVWPRCCIALQQIDRFIATYEESHDFQLNTILIKISLNVFNTNSGHRRSKYLMFKIKTWIMIEQLNRRMTRNWTVAKTRCHIIDLDIECQPSLSWDFNLSITNCDYLHTKHLKFNNLRI